MSEFGNQYNSLQGFAYSTTAIINALAKLNNTLSSLTIGNPLEVVSFENHGQIITNTYSYTQTFNLSPGICKNYIGFILEAKSNNSRNVLLNHTIELKPGTIFVLTVEQNRIFEITSVTVTLEPNDSIAYLPICVSVSYTHLTLPTTPYV